MVAGIKIAYSLFCYFNLFLRTLNRFGFSLFNTQNISSDINISCLGMKHFFKACCNTHALILRVVTRSCNLGLFIGLIVKL